MNQQDPVNKFVKELEKGKKKAMFFIQADSHFYVDIGERTLESALKEKQSPKYRRQTGVQLWAKGGDMVGGIQF